MYTYTERGRTQQSPERHRVCSVNDRGDCAQVDCTCGLVEQDCGEFNLAHRARPRAVNPRFGNAAGSALHYRRAHYTAPLQYSVHLHSVVKYSATVPFGRASVLYMVYRSRHMHARA
jgi:hypothetical protein